ncbi:type II toxin-antitoxin system HicB family antitoxin [Segatella bryantii]|jgi:predicted HicB family RNase H-like nuclease|uniref:type II toxin-antitoxin system HicB family antitoxin n=1 Tax=Segatella bryantii TaxID=77095 RepID=UPI002479F11A|nr:type II toxin-antitoxin system HicB family antitoxin [Segatella bryantii]
MDYLEYKGYKGSVEYSKEDNCLFGKVQGLSKELITYEGQTLDELRKDFEDGVESYLGYCKEEGLEPAKPYSGKLNLRMPSELHSRVAAFVASTGITINDFINRAIKNELKKVAAL